MEEKILHIKNWLGTGSINIFGIQFAGKDTVGKQLAEILDAELLSSGDIVRAARDSNNERIRAAAHVADTGALMPMDEYKEMITNYIENHTPPEKPLVLSAVGRWVGEEIPVIRALSKTNHDLKAVLSLEISEQEVYRRFDESKRLADRNVGRADETMEGLERRLNEFRDKTLPVIAKYRDMGLLIEINGEQSREAVFTEVVDKLFQMSCHHHK